MDKIIDIETTFLETSDFVMRIIVSFLLGAVIGAERQWRQKSAGLRTNTLVSVGATAYMLLAVYIYGNDGGDPSRIAAQIVTGIGFLGAGVIMKDGFNIQGLNTAATIWCSAAVGSLCGLGLFPEALIVSGAIVSVHLVMRPLGDWMGRIKSYKVVKSEESFYILDIVCTEKHELGVRSFLVDYLDKSDQLLLRSIGRQVSPDEAGKVLVKVKLSIVGKQEKLLESVLTELTKTKGVKEVSWHYLGNSKEHLI
ncbi:MgtC/SapB family protein [Sphingobacterium sp. UT-1RO-CII-1]|uniref:MgtC/SapB family protein n=1 Tax=Sphingobacterium sp. UT-1RO-CII-1 TaxID=2995225 RepID=UPI00227D1533|nr:MgtC/SapB family protein [Sphingobacterium sp. UT-1RO-CII-1]MCY4779591.1 MgtC/SapB family protein [Sphingobacterium sp. UT-1RO-CII-1]